MTLGPAEVGSTANSYEIIARLAIGGMAEIFLARGTSTAGVERYVVLKRVLRNRADDAAFVRMFLDEARLAAQLQHPNIAQVYDVGKLGDSYFFTMEYVHGETVRALLQRSHGLRKQIPLGAILAIIAGAAAGLHHAHDRRGLDGRPLGIVHRDVSPSNLMLSYEGHVKVVDFGVAKAAHRSTETASGTVKGKISYLSPEQARGGTIDRRSDLFALGIVFWELLTLERLFRRNSDFENMVAIVNEPVRAPSELRSDVPAELDAIVMRLLDKDPAMRFQTADELHEAIEQVAVRVGTSLSSASLGRYLRELFGTRPEPWVEMRSSDAHGGNPVTLTSEPIPSELVTPLSEDVDLSLRGVPDLTAPRYSSESSGHRMPSEGVMTTPRPTVEDPELQTARDVRRRSAPASRSPDPTRRSGSHSAPPAGVPTVPLKPQAQVTMMASAPPPPSTPPANAPMSRPRVDPSWSHPSVSGPAYEPEPVRRRGGVPRFVYIAGPALAIAIVIIIVMATGGGGNRSEQAVTDAHEMRVHAPEVAAAAGPTPPTPAPVATPADAAVAPVPAPTPAPAPTPIAKTPPPSPPAPPSHPHAPRPSPEEDLQKAFHADRYSDVVQACTTMPSLVAQDPVACTVSACHVHDASHALKWLKATGGKRSAVLTACAQAGTNLEPRAAPPPTPPTPPTPKHNDCAANPLDCQH